MKGKDKIIGKEEIIKLCDKALKLPYEKRGNRDSFAAQQNVATLRMLLLAGCEHRVVTTGSLASDSVTRWIEVKYTPREDREKRDYFYLPTAERLKSRKGEDRY